jgi:hypothetical protein
MTLPTVRTARPVARAEPARAPTDRDLSRVERDRKASGALVVLALLGVLAFDLSPRIAALDARSLDRIVPTPAPTPRQVSFKPQELIMPPEELTVSQYDVTIDQAYPDTGREPQWRRVFAPRSSKSSTTSPGRPWEYGNIEFRVGVLEAGRFITPGCTGWTWSGEQPTESAAVPDARTFGDRSVLCRFRFADGTRWFVSWVADRNVETITYLFARATAGDKGATDLVEALSQQQLAIVARVAPR